MSTQGNPLLDSILQPADPGAKLHNLALRGLIGRMEGQESQGYFAPPPSEDYITNELSKHLPSLVSNTTQQQLHKQASEAALKSYTTQKLGVPEGVQSYLEGAGNLLSSFVQPIDPQTGLPNVGLQHAVVPTAVKAARALQIAQEGRAPVSRFEGFSKAVMDAISERNTVYHATDPEAAVKILESGEISSNPWLHQGLGKTKVKKLISGKNLAKADIEEGFKQLFAHPPSDPYNPNPKGYDHLYDINDNIHIETYPLHVKDKSGKIVAHLNSPYDVYVPSGNELVNEPAYKVSGSTSEGGFFSNSFTNEQEAKKFALDQYFKSVPENPNAGVSVSRVPRISPKAEKAISFELDASKLPPSRPFAEPGYGKTKQVKVNMPTLNIDHVKLTDMRGMSLNDKMPQESYINSLINVSDADKAKGIEFANDKDFIGMQSWLAQHKARIHDEINNAVTDIPNRQFESENRTFNQPIDVSAIKRVLIDRSAIRHSLPKDIVRTMVQNGILPGSEAETNLLKDYFGKYLPQGTPIEVHESGRAMHSARVSRFKDTMQAFLKAKIAAKEGIDSPPVSALFDNLHESLSQKENSLDTLQEVFNNASSK